MQSTVDDEFLSSGIIDIEDIIDVSSFDDSDGERWLYTAPHQSTSETTVRDLRAWLKAEPEITGPSYSSSGARRCIDTRTFTRPKKRSSGMTFESIVEALTPTTVPDQPNIWEPQLPKTGQESQRKQEIKMKSEVPVMLRPTSMMSGLQAHELSLGVNAASFSGQESMEAFLNMSQSKGIDSFINLAEPEFSDLLMNVSQPSTFYSSMLQTQANDVSHVSQTTMGAYQNQSLVDSQILTESMMQTSMFGDENLVSSFNETLCTSNSRNDTVLENKSYNVTNDTLSEKLNSLDSEKPADAKMNETFVSYPTAKVEEVEDRVSDADVTPIAEMNSTIVLDTNKTFGIEHQPTHKKELNSTFDTPTEFRNGSVSPDKDIPRAMDSTFRASSSLRRELLQEIQRNNCQKLNSTYNQQESTSKRVLDCTFSESPSNVFARNEIKKDETMVLKKSNPTHHEIDRRFYTFTKRNNNAAVHREQAKSEENNTKNLDATFSKPLAPPKRKDAARTLSKLPQFLQKSNPNLISSSLKTSNNNFIGKHYDGSNSKMGKCESLSSKLYSLRKLKSGSEQRLLDVTMQKVSDFQILGSGTTTEGSTESIASTQSAHSAPDLDDRLSVCSDSSTQRLYSVCSLKTEQWQRIARMQEENLKQESTPKPSRRVMENTWVEEEKNLPSPILKQNGSNASIENQQESDVAFHTSSPVFTPDSPIHSANAAGNMEINDGKSCTPLSQEEDQQQEVRNSNEDIKHSEVSSKTSKNVKVESKTRLKQPTNWSGGNKPSSTISGIPRPASRIPAPRFARPSSKSGQVAARK